MSSGMAPQRSHPGAPEPSRAPLPSLSERRLHGPWAISHVPERSARCPLVPFGMTGFDPAHRRPNSGLSCSKAAIRKGQ